MSEHQNNDRREDVDDSGSLVAGPAKRQLSTGKKLGVAALLLVIVLSFIWIGDRSRAQPKGKMANFSIDANAATFRPAPIAPPPPAPQPVSLPLPSPPARQHGPHEITPAESPIFAYGGEGAVPPPPSSAPSGPTAPAASRPAAGAPAEPETALSGLLKPTILRPTKAALLPHPDMLVTQGTIIPCTLQTAIDTQLAGYVKCVLPQDVRGTTGNVILLDRGTTVVGEIQSGLQEGQNRAFILWDRAETPDHAVITLASPTTDELGRSGVSGEINNHFWDKFGGALLLSVVQGGLQIGSSAANGSGGGSSSGTVVNSFQSNGSSVADTALRGSINIPPTLEKNQGDNVAIFVAKDLDFSDIYSLSYIGSDTAKAQNSAYKPGH